MIKTPTFSILIPTRNRCRYVLDAINSVLATEEESVEIIVSENWSTDGTSEVLSAIQDSRVTIVKPKRVLAMHENFEYLLGLASGEWVSFLGDDDAIMPYAFVHMRKIVGEFRYVEAVSSARAYYCWEGCELPVFTRQRSFSADKRLRLMDSKKSLQKCLDGNLQYFDTPQLYTGGFQKKTLIERIKRLQGGIYYKSTTPDAYSALMCMLHTTTYVRSEIPLFWTGSSPTKKKGSVLVGKDRDKDFWGLHDRLGISQHPAMAGLPMRSASFTLHFYEAFVSAIPFTSTETLCLSRLRQLIKKNVLDLAVQGRQGEANELICSADRLGIKLKTPYSLSIVGNRFYLALKRICRNAILLASAARICRVEETRREEELTINSYCLETQRCIDLVKELTPKRRSLCHYDWE